MKPLAEGLFAALAVDPDERRLAGQASGAFYLIGGITLALLAVLPGVTHAHRVQLLGLGGFAGAWGLSSLLAIAWEDVPGELMHLSAIAALTVISLAIAASGGAASPAWIYLFFVAVFASYFFAAPAAVAYLVACVAVQAAASVYDPRALHDEFVAQFTIAAPAYLALGGAIIAGKRLMWRLRARAERLAEEQGALRRVATAVVGGQSSERIYELVAIEAAALLRAGAAGILRLETPDVATVIGSWSDHAGGRYQPGTDVPVRPGGDVARAIESGAAVRIGQHPPNSPVERLGYSSSIVAPVRVADRTWGVLAVTAAAPHAFTSEDDQRLMAFGDLLATAISSIEDRAQLATQASSDALTALANHRSLQQRLAAEVARAMRHGSPLSVAVIDIDHFKQINDGGGGHEAGDQVLVAVARCLSGLARAEDTLGRVGGDEFAWILPETTREQAVVAVERARRLIAASTSRQSRITVSAGICDTTATQDPAELLHFADRALYWSKAHGRNQCWIYDPAVVDELSAQERARRLERSQALAGLRALARAIDAKDPVTSKHSERVAELVGRLALAVGWAPDRARLLSEAALVHDVGKIGIPDVLLRKPAPLSEPERAQIRAHAELSERIVEDVLAPEQVEWIGTHHERPDGRGYPRHLRGDQIPEGGALLAAADAWDVMTVSRPYSLPKAPEQALAECIELVGRQFTRTAVGALVELHSRGELGPEMALAGEL